MFKKTLLASSVFAAIAAIPAVANESSADDKYGHDLYGVIAVQLANRDYKEDNKNSGFQINNETRLGWRGHARFDSLPEHTKFIWQVETGYVDPSFSNRSGSYFGERDTFVGFDSERFGLVRAGRVLTPLYELVDWPGSNPGLGDVWDWGGTIGGVKHNDRQSDTIRWDTMELWTGFTLDLAAGAGNDRSDSTGSEKSKNNYWHGGAAHQRFDLGSGNWIQLDLAYEMNYNTRSVAKQVGADDDDPGITNYWDNKAWLVGVQGGLGPVGYFAQYRRAEAETEEANSSTVKEKQDSYTTGLMYNFGANNKWQAKSCLCQE
ncbi:porin [Endozoicomonas lisbonensis]|uniref:porin n=1 Tax=Endozoicomonas lisbonensis TaxID=3120522 RepID=UPI003397A908